MIDSATFERAIAAFDAANARDPQQQLDEDGRSWPAQLLHAHRLSRWVEQLDPSASAALRLAAHCQHLERWSIPRDRYPAGRLGYKKWRSELAVFHAQRAGDILGQVGCPNELIEQVQAINLKQDIKGQRDTQTMEDALCLVFLQFQLTDFAAKHDEPKLTAILRKTWSKMSERGQQAALTLDYTPEQRRLLEATLRP